MRARKERAVGDTITDQGPLVTSQRPIRVPSSTVGFRCALPDPDPVVMQSKVSAWSGGVDAVSPPAALSDAVLSFLRALPSDPAPTDEAACLDAGLDALRAFDAHVQLQTLLLLADALRGTSPQACVPLLREALADRFAPLLERGLPGPAPAIAGLCAFALRAGIARERVRSLIRRHGLKPEPADIADGWHWPWPVRIHSLGRFSVVCDDEPLSFNGKPPRRALSLLQALIANGGREVSIPQLIHNLWPEEADGDLKNLFDNTLHRLRKVLGPVDVIQMRNGKLTIDTSVCWIDVWAFYRLTSASLSAAAPPDPEQGTVLMSQSLAAMRLYGGHFLQSEGDLPWIAPYRDRAKSRFLRLVAMLGTRLEAQGRWAQAVEVVERGLEVDGICEPLFQQLMLCHQRQGQHAEVLRTYRRCREMLSIVLGVRPAHRTEQIRMASAHAASLAVPGTDTPQIKPPACG